MGTNRSGIEVKIMKEGQSKMKTWVLMKFFVFCLLSGISAGWAAPLLFHEGFEDGQQLQYGQPWWFPPEQEGTDKRVVTTEKARTGNYALRSYLNRNTHTIERYGRDANFRTEAILTKNPGSWPYAHMQINVMAHNYCQRLATFSQSNSQGDI